MSTLNWNPIEGLIPIFPLPNLVMFPRAVQFLHIFEPRYRRMMQDLLGDDDSPHLLAMALLKPDFQEHYYTNHAKVHPILCLCEVIRHERLPDGRYNLLIQGRARARIGQEDRNGAYRRAALEILSPSAPVDGPSSASQTRTVLREMLDRPPFDSIEGIEKYRQWLDSDLSLGAAVDLLAFYLLPTDEPDLRQTLLYETQPSRRADLLVSHLDTLGRVLMAQRQPFRDWPPEPAFN